MQVLFKKENQKFVLIVAFTPFLQDGEDPTEWVLYKFAGTKTKKKYQFSKMNYSIWIYIFFFARMNFQTCCFHLFMTNNISIIGKTW